MSVAVLFVERYFKYTRYILMYRAIFVDKQIVTTVNGHLLVFLGELVY